LNAPSSKVKSTFLRSFDKKNVNEIDSIGIPKKIYALNGNGK
jgi:hypothetical protein